MRKYLTLFFWPLLIETLAILSARIFDIETAWPYLAIDAILAFYIGYRAVGIVGANLLKCALLGFMFAVMSFVIGALVALFGSAIQVDAGHASQAVAGYLISAVLHGLLAGAIAFAGGYARDKVGR